MPTLKRESVELYYELEGNGPPVVLISGFGCNSADPGFTYMRHLLVDRYTVLVPDNQGSGRTINKGGATVTIEEMADDIAAIMDHHHIGVTHTLGHSMGGMIAMALALRHPEKVCSQVIAASSARFPSVGRTIYYLDTVRAMLDTNIPREMMYRFMTFAILDEQTFQNDDLIDAFVKAPAYPYEQTHAGYELQIAAARSCDLRSELASMRTPTFIVSSPGDLLAPPSFQDELAMLIPNAEIKHYPGGHMFLGLPINFEQFISDVTTFWEKNS